MDARGTWNHLRNAYDRIDLDARFAVRTHLDTIRLKNAQDVERFLAEFNGCFQKLAAMGKKSGQRRVHLLGHEGLTGDGHLGTVQAEPADAHHRGRRVVVARCRSTPSLSAFRPKLVASTDTSSLSSRDLDPSTPTQRGNPNQSRPSSAPARVHKRNPSGVSCTVCGKSTHDKDHCWEKGGGAEGQKPAWMVMRDTERINVEVQHHRTPPKGSPRRHRGRQRGPGRLSSTTAIYQNTAALPS